MKVDDTDGIKEFSIKKSGGLSIYGGSPGASGNVGACSGTSPSKSVASGTVTLESADFPLNASVTDCRTGAAVYSFSVPNPGGVPTTTPTPQPISCGNGEKCVKDSWCSNGQKCFYPDSQITCAAWPAPGSAVMSPSCPSTTSVCDPTDMNCVSPGQTVAYVNGKWCSQSQTYYSADGKNMTCVSWGGVTPVGYSVCRPDDRSCIPENGFGPSSGSCNNSMKCYQKATDTNSNNDIY